MTISVPHLRLSAAALALAVLAAVAGCSKSGSGSSPTARPESVAQPPAPAASKLGDLTTFRAIAMDVAAIVDKGDLPAAKIRIKDLEVAWDAAEAGLKPRAAADWHVLDKAIDRVLEALRADKPTQANCHDALSALIGTFDHLAGKA